MKVSKYFGVGLDEFFIRIKKFIQAYQALRNINEATNATFLTGFFLLLETEVQVFLICQTKLVQLI